MEGMFSSVERDVIFNESSLTYKPKVTPPTDVQAVGDNMSNPTGVISNLQPIEALEAHTSADQTTPIISDASPITSQPETDNPLDNSVDMVSHLLAETNSINFEPTKDPLILDQPRKRTKHDYKQLHQRGFVKAAKVTPTPSHSVIVPKTYEEAISGPQAKEW